MPWLEHRLGAPLALGTEVRILPGTSGIPCEQHPDWLMAHSHQPGAIGTISGELDDDGDYSVSVEGHPLFVHHNGVEAVWRPLKHRERSHVVH